MTEPYITMTPRGRYDALATCSCGWSELCKSQWTAQDRADVHFRDAHPQPVVPDSLATVLRTVLAAGAALAADTECTTRTLSADTELALRRWRETEAYGRSVLAVPPAERGE